MDPAVPAETVCDRSNPGACNPCIDTKVPCTCNDGGSCEINYLSQGTVCDAADAGITLGVCEIAKCGGNNECIAGGLEEGTGCFTDNDVQCANAGTCDGSGVCTSIGCPGEPPVEVCLRVGQPCTDINEDVGICCVDPASPTIILQCVDAPCPCGTCTSKSNGKNIAYCTNDGAAASESCDNSCGSCTTGNGEGLEPMPNPPFFTGAACANANSCDRKTFIPALLPGSNPNKFCPGSQSCVTCKRESISGGQGCCLATNAGQNDPAEPCPS